MFYNIRARPIDKQYTNIFIFFWMFNVFYVLNGISDISYVIIT